MIFDFWQFIVNWIQYGLVIRSKSKNDVWWWNLYSFFHIINGYEVLILNFRYFNDLDVAQDITFRLVVGHGFIIKTLIEIMFLKQDYLFV